jgi:multiple sugar transport system permease protein
MGFTSLEEAVTPWNLMMAASLMTLLPIIIIFIVAQKHFIASAAGSGLKG